MLKGLFRNCYGLADFELKEIAYSASETGKNCAIIYAPNGILKSSLAKVFDDISKKKKTTDRIFTELKSEYSVSYYDETYDEKVKKAGSNIYVVHSFDEKFESSSDSVSTILADDSIRKRYEEIISVNSAEIDNISANLSTFSGIASKNIQSTLMLDFDMDENDDWFRIIDVLSTSFSDYEYISELKGVSYSILFNPQTQRVYENPDFLASAKSFTEILDDLINKSHILSSRFDDHNVSEFSKSLEKNDIFSAEHKIVMKDGTEVKDITAWKALVDNEFERIYTSPDLSDVFSRISKLLNANEAARQLKELLMQNRLLISHLSDLYNLRKHLWLNYLVDAGIDIAKTHKLFSSQKSELLSLSDKAQKQKAYWEKVVNDFKYRFRTPFEVSITNSSKVVFSGEPARLTFTYVRGDERKEKSKDELMSFLSVGEKRALYLLQILFDLEKIRSKIKKSGKKHLIIVDDIADSFDYNNKYAIIEYLKELVDNQFIDLLILTHNFDFYRTVSERISIPYNNCYVVQKIDDYKLEMDEFRYRRDFFKKGMLDKIKDGKIEDDASKMEIFIAAIPFARNISDYLFRKDDVDFFTSLVHIKDNTSIITIKTLWSRLQTIFGLSELSIAKSLDFSVKELIYELANNICTESKKGVCLEEKIVLSIAIRLKAEEFLYTVLTANGIKTECDSNQTREWIKRAELQLNSQQKELLEKVNLITPENIHVNAFMYEPLIDIPNWKLIELYKQDYEAI